ncbi:MAG: hypothetical protein RBQ76_10170 [Sulfurovum sp.]|jgi:hypothetical protein|nr:hypothetical protein [Sulfurovum sp.]
MFNAIEKHQMKRDQSREHPKGTSFRALSAEDKQLYCSTSEALNAESWNPVLTISNKESCLNGKFFNRDRMELCSISVLQMELRNV